MPWNASHADGRESWVQAGVTYGLVAALVCVAWLGSTDVVSMEGIVADGALHMARGGDWIVPHLYGQTYNYKPPLTYWLALASFELFGGPGAWALRLPISLCAAGMGLAVLVLIGSVTSPRCGCLCAVASLTGWIAIQKARIAEFDMPLAAGVGVAMAVACRNFVLGRGGTAMWELGYIGLAFGTMAKGPAALMVYVPGLVLAALATRRLGVLLSWRHAAGAASFVLVISAYLWALVASGDAVALRQPLEEAWIRSTAWTWRDAGVSALKPVIALAIFLPWSAMVVLGLSPAWRRSLDDPAQRLVAAAGAFLVAGVGVFMAIPTHESRYYLPLCVPLGIVAGVVTTSAAETVEAWRTLRTTLARAIAAVSSALAVFGGIQTGLHRLPWEQRAVLIGLGLVAAAAALAPQRFRALSRPARLMILAALCCWAVQALIVQPRRAESRSMRGLAAELAPGIPPEASVWIDIDDDYSSLVFYLRRTARTFRSEHGWPAPGSLMILFPEQYRELSRQTAHGATELRRARYAGREFILCRRNNAERGPAVPPAP